MAGPFALARPRCSVQRAAWTKFAAFAICFAKAWIWSRRPPPIFDGDGRTDAKALERSVSLTYATESMRLTNPPDAARPLAAAAPRGQGRRMTLSQAKREKTKVKTLAADPGRTTMIEKACRSNCRT